MAKPQEKELGGARNMRTSTKIIIGIFAVIMALSMMLPSLSAIFAGSTEAKEQEEAAASAAEDEAAKEEEAKKDENSEAKDKGEDKGENKDEDADPKVPDNKDLKSLEESNSETAKKFKDRLKEDPNNLAALYNLGETYMNWGYSANSSASTDEERDYAKQLLNKAMSYYDRYLGLNDSITVKINRSLCQYYAGDADGAVKALQQVCDENPENAIAQAQLGYLYESQFNNEKATEAYHKAVELDPDDAQGVKSYANQRIIALNAKVSSVEELNDSGIESSEPQSELMQKISQNSDVSF